MTPGKVLIVDDDTEAQDLIRNILGLDGLYTYTTTDGHQAVTSVERETPNLVLLDLRLPGIDGFEVCRRIRQSSRVPVIAVSALNSLEERERFRKLGGDDYITKPFSSEELRFRVRAALEKGTSIPPPTESFRFTDDYLSIDFDARIVEISNKKVAFSAREYAVLGELVAHAGKPLTHKHLLREAWGTEYINDMNILYLCISRIRHKIERDPIHPQYIVTVPKLGYRFGIKTP